LNGHKDQAFQRLRDLNEVRGKSIGNAVRSKHDAAHGCPLERVRNPRSATGDIFPRYPVGMAIDLDHNATTPCLPEVWEAMRPWAVASWSNPASSHGAGRAARRALEDSREEIASLLGAWPDEVVFTSGATEANAMALAGIGSGNRVAASDLDHPSIRENLTVAESRGARVSRLPRADRGIINPRDWAALCPEAPNLQVATLAGHETGAVQDMPALIDASRRRFGEAGAWHIDATQAAGKIPVDFHRLEVSTLSFSAHKFFGPKGVGALLVRRAVSLPPLFVGGGQQRGRRSGTEAVYLAVGMAKALRMAVDGMADRQNACSGLRERFLSGLSPCKPWEILGPLEGGLDHVLLIAFPGVRSDMALMALDLEGISCSAGAACSSGSSLPSPALGLIGLPEEHRRSVIRFSLGPFLNTEEVSMAGSRVANIIARLRGPHA
jgi:cysteine desulfurase